MVECPYCNGEVAELALHIREQHPEHSNAKAEPSPREAVKAKVPNMRKRALQRLEEQNEILLLQFQQNSLITALKTGQLPQRAGQEQPQQQTGVNAVSEAVKLIQAVQEGFPANKEAQPDIEEQMMYEAMDLIKAHVASKTIPSPPPLQPTPTPDLSELAEAIGSPPESDVVDIDGEVTTNAETNNSMGDGVPPAAIIADKGTKSNKRAPKSAS